MFSSLEVDDRRHFIGQRLFGFVISWAEIQLIRGVEDVISLPLVLQFLLYDLHVWIRIDH